MALSKEGINKSKLRFLLLENNIEAIKELSFVNGNALIKILSRLLYDRDYLVRWRVVSAFGELSVISPDLVRRTVSRLAWTLNDEAGCRNWGAPVVLAEIGYHDLSLVDEVIRIVLHYIDDPETSLPPNRNVDIVVGVLWSIARFAKSHPNIAKEVVGLVIPFLADENSNIRGHALWALESLSQFIKASDNKDILNILLLLKKDCTKFNLYLDRQIISLEINKLAINILAKLK